MAQHDPGQRLSLPYNIERDERAQPLSRQRRTVASFAEKDLNVELRDGILIVTGKREDAEKTDTKSVLYQGIAGRAFERRFQLAEHVEVRGAKLENGLLHVDLEAGHPGGEEAPAHPDQARRKRPRLKTIEGSAKAA